MGTKSWLSFLVVELIDVRQPESLRRRHRSSALRPFQTIPVGSLLFAAPDLYLLM